MFFGLTSQIIAMDGLIIYLSLYMLERIQLYRSTALREEVAFERVELRERMGYTDNSDFELDMISAFKMMRARLVSKKEKVKLEETILFHKKVG